ncbi:hypothetical protein Tco_0192268, partial [Tanacetum coccineum]
VTFSSSGTPSLVPVPSLEVAETTMDSSRTPGILPVLSVKPLVLGCLLLVFLLSLRAYITSATSCSLGVKDWSLLSLSFEEAGFGFGPLGVS